MTEEVTREQRLAAAAAWGPVLRDEEGAELSEEHLLAVTDEALFNTLAHWTVGGDVREAMHIPEDFVEEVSAILDALGEQPETATSAAAPMARLITDLPVNLKFAEPVFALAVIALMGSFVCGTVVEGVQQFAAIIKGLAAKKVNAVELPQGWHAEELLRMAQNEISYAVQRGYPEKMTARQLREFYSLTFQFKFGALTEDETREKMATAFGVTTDDIEFVTNDGDEAA